MNEFERKKRFERKIWVKKSTPPLRRIRRLLRLPGAVPEWFPWTFFWRKKREKRKIIAKNGIDKRFERKF